MKIEHSKVEELLKEVSATIILPKQHSLPESDIYTKSKGDIVTSIDRECEDFLASRLLALMPGSQVIGEESVHENPGLMSSLHSTDPVWVIDPLDGTRNYVNGNGPFAIMLCLIHEGETLAAWIYDPVEDLLTSAERGGGTFQNGVKTEICSSYKQLDELVGALRTFYIPEPLKTPAEQSASRFRQIDNSMSAGYDYPALVSNKLQFLFYYRTLVWDHAPGVLIAQEAGAVVRRPDGSRYTPVDDKVGLLCASSRDIWFGVQAAIVPSIEILHIED